MAAARRRRPGRSRDDVLRRVGFAWLAAAALVAALAGCGGAKKPQLLPERIYFLRHGHVQPVLRMVPSATPTISAIAELSKGPNFAERSTLGLTNAVTGTYRVDPAKGIVKVNGGFSRAELAQLVYTITQHAGGIAAVDGHAYTRKDFEDETPIILVESPLPVFARHEPAAERRGRRTPSRRRSSTTFATRAASSLKTHFVTATSGTGTRGTFDFTVPFRPTERRWGQSRRLRAFGKGRHRGSTRSRSRCLRARAATCAASRAGRGRPARPRRRSSGSGVAALFVHRAGLAVARPHDALTKSGDQNGPM